MKTESRAAYACPKEDRGLHHWKFDNAGIATCTKCDVVLTEEESADLKHANDRFLRELARRK